MARLAQTKRYMHLIPCQQAVDAQVRANVDENSIVADILFKNCA